MSGPVNPFSPSFAPASRWSWSRATLKWLKKHHGLGAQGLAAMLGVNAQTVRNYVGHPERVPIWYPLLLCALVEGWRPSRDWTTATDKERQEVFLAAVRGAGMDTSFHGCELFGVATSDWWRSLVSGRTPSLAPRLAILAELLASGQLTNPVLPIQSWEP